MTIWEAIILGIVQGLTEFLPVSSSGHLVLFRGFLDSYYGLLTFEVFVHIGTALAVLIVFWRDVLKLLLFKDPQYRHFALMLVMAMIPTAIMGIWFEGWIEALFASSLLVGFALLFTGVLLYLSNIIQQGVNTITHIRTLDAIIIGFAQGLAIVPGISRSGSTIVGALSRGLNREDAARFSFVLSIPTILGAGLYHSRTLIHGSWDAIAWSSLLAGTLAAFVAGYVAIKVLLRILQQGKLHYFSYYCWIVGIYVILRHIF